MASLIPRRFSSVSVGIVSSNNRMLASCNLQPLFELCYINPARVQMLRGLADTKRARHQRSAGIDLPTARASKLSERMVRITDLAQGIERVKHYGKNRSHLSN